MCLFRSLATMADSMFRVPSMISATSATNSPQANSPAAGNLPRSGFDAFRGGPLGTSGTSFAGLTTSSSMFHQGSFTRGGSDGGADEGITIDSVTVCNVPYFSGRDDSQVPATANPFARHDPLLASSAANAVNDDEEDEPWSMPRPVEEGEDDFADLQVVTNDLSLTFHVPADSRRSSLMVPTPRTNMSTNTTPRAPGGPVESPKSSYASPFVSLTVEAVRKSCVLHSVRHSSSAPVDIPRMRLARWIDKHRECFAFAWWVGAGTAGLLDAGLLELLDQLDPTGCASQLAAAIPGNAIPVGEGLDNIATPSGVYSGGGVRSTATQPRAGLPILQAAVELMPHKQRTCLLVLDGTNLDVLQYFFQTCAPRFGLHVVAFCDDYTPIAADKGIGLLTKLGPLDLTIPDPDRAERFCNRSLEWTGVHLTAADQVDLAERRRTRDLVLEERKRRAREDPLHVVSRQPKWMSRKNSSRTDLSEAASEDSNTELDDEDYNLMQQEGDLQDKVMQLQRLSRALRHSPVLMSMAHRFLRLLRIADVHGFVRSVCETIEALKTYKLTRNATLIKNCRPLTSARSLLAPSSATVPDSPQPYLPGGTTPATPSRRLSMGPLASLATPKFVTSPSFTNVNSTASPLSPSTGSPLFVNLPARRSFSPQLAPVGSFSSDLPSARARHLPPRRRSHRTRSTSFIENGSAYDPLETTLRSEFGSMRKASAAGAFSDGVPAYSQRSDLIGANRIATSDEAAALMAVCISFAHSPKDASSRRNTKETLVSLEAQLMVRVHDEDDNNSWTYDDVALLQLSVAMPPVFPVTVFGPNVVERMVDLGLWVRLGPLGSLVMVSKEILAGVEVLCRVLDGSGPTQVGSGNLASDLLGGFVPSSFERAYSIAGSWLHASHTTKTRDHQWLRWQQPLNNFVVREVSRRNLFLPDAPSLLQPPRSPPLDLTNLPCLPAELTLWQPRLLQKLLVVLPDLEGRGRHEEVALILERALALCLTLLENRVLQASSTNRSTKTSFVRSMSSVGSLASMTRRMERKVPIGPLAAIYCLFKDLSEVYVKASMAGVGERYIERAVGLAKAVCGDRRDTPAMAESQYLQGRIQYQLAAAEASRGAVTQQIKVLGSDVGSNMQLTAVLRADVERKQYIVEASKFFTEAAHAWADVPSSAIGDELALCHRTVSAAMTHELRDRDALRCAKQALDSAAGATRSMAIPMHLRPVDARLPVSIRDALEWARGQLPAFIRAIEEGCYDEAAALIECSTAVAYLALAQPAFEHDETILACGTHGATFAEQIRPLPAVQEHLRCYTTISEIDVAKHHGTAWLAVVNPKQATQQRVVSSNSPNRSRTPAVSRAPPSPAISAEENRNFDALLDANFNQGDASMSDSIVPLIKLIAATQSPALFGSVSSAAALVTATERRKSLIASSPAASKQGVAYRFGAHVLLETCDPSDVKALELLARILDAGFDPRACSPHSMETLLHIAVRRNLVLFIGLLLAHPLVNVEYVPPYRCVARRDGLSTMATVQKVPSRMLSPLELCDVPLTVELLLLKGHTPLATFQRNRTLCVRKLVTMPMRLGKLFAGPLAATLLTSSTSGRHAEGAFHDDVPSVLRETGLTTEERCAIAPFCPPVKIFTALESADEPEVVRTLAQLVTELGSMGADSLDEVLRLSESALPDIPSADAPLMGEFSPHLAAQSYYSRSMVARFAKVMTVLVRRRKFECVQVLVDDNKLSIDLLHWEDAAEYRRDRRALAESDRERQLAQRDGGVSSRGSPGLPRSRSPGSLSPAKGTPASLGGMGYRRGSVPNISVTRESRALASVPADFEKYVAAFSSLRRQSFDETNV
jgi:hypothetical protein